MGITEPFPGSLHHREIIPVGFSLQKKPFEFAQLRSWATYSRATAGFPQLGVRARFWAKDLRISNQSFLILLNLGL